MFVAEHAAFFCLQGIIKEERVSEEGDWMADQALIGTKCIAAGSRARGHMAAHALHCRKRSFRL